MERVTRLVVQPRTAETCSTSWEEALEKRLKRTLGVALMVMMVAAGTLAGLPGVPMPSAAATGANTNPALVVAYSANVENLIGHTANPAVCQRAYTRLADYMAAQPLAPDFVLIQQVSDQANLDKFISALSARTGRPYAGFIAVSPRPMGTGNCRTGTGQNAGETDLISDQKKYQTNAIIYRTGRFHLVGSKHTWKSDAQKVAGGTCSNAADFDSSQDRTINVAGRFYDDKAAKHVTVASFHWPSGNVGSGNNEACAQENVSELVDHTSDATMGLSALQISGGDANVLGVDAAGTWQPWYTAAHNLGLRDAVRERCAAMGLSNVDCEATNWTSPNKVKRIDYLFAGSSTGTGNGATIPYEAVGPVTTVSDQYSDHRAVQGYFYY